MVFNGDTVKGTEIKEGQQYQGIRIHLLALLGKARINLQFDVGFGDAVTPKAETVKFPTVLDFPAPELRAYPKETVVAEKFEAMVKLGMTNSRMKDFWDLRVMIQEFEFDGATLKNAIQATFERRQTAFTKDLPLDLTDEFSSDKGKQTQWNAFIRKNKLNDTASLETVIASFKNFFSPIILAVNNQKRFSGKLEFWSMGILTVTSNPDLKRVPNIELGILIYQ